MRVEVKVEIERSRADVWAYLADSENLTIWSGDFSACDRHPDDRDAPGAGARYRFTLNAPARSGVFEYVEFDPPSNLIWESEPVKSTGGWVRPRGGYLLEEASGGDATLVTLVFEPELGGAMKLLSPLIRRSILRGRTADAARLKEILEKTAA